MTLTTKKKSQGENDELRGYRVQTQVIKDPHELEQDWIDLQSRADCSYFQSWGWIGTWLQQIAVDLHPSVIRVWYQNTLVGMGILVRKRVRRHHIIRSNALFLNEYPFDDRNMVIEYNGLLAERDHKNAVYSVVIRHLVRDHKQWDECLLGAVSEEELGAVASAETDEVSVPSRCKRLEASPAWSVDLNSFDQGVDAYLMTLSKNRRAQIRRALRLYEESAPVQLEEAQDTEQALAYFDALGNLHTDRWQQKGLPGSFANPRWVAFHRSLIQSRFAEGEIQLLRVGNVSGPIGYLYNFVWRKRVYVVQMGFSLSEDKRLKPGYVAHALAIAHNKKKGMQIYDLMHGDALYKRSLCNQNHMLYWLVVQHTRLKFRLEDLLVAGVRMCRRLG